MTDYSQPAAVTKRVRFFDGQYLQDQDFVDEQKYQLDRTRRLSRLLGFTGIGEGLVVSEVAGTAYTLKVTAGTAVDPLGRQLVLPADATLVLPADGFARQQNVAVLVAFRESETDVAQTGGRSARRWDETPVVAAVTTGGAVAVSPAGASTTLDRVTVPLATVSINDQGVIVVSRVAGRPTELTVGSILTTGSVGIGTTTPENAEDWARTLDLYGKASAKLSVRMDGIDTRLMAHTGFWGAPAGMVLGTKTNHAVSIGTGQTTRLTVTETGHVGIGTATPENAEGWARTLDLYGKASAKLSVRMDGIDARLMAHTGFWGAPAGMVLGTKTNHAVSIATKATSRVTVTATGDVGIGTATPSARLDVAGKGGTSIDLVVNGRLKSNNQDGGLWVTDDRFIGGLADGKVGFFNKDADWGLVMAKSGDVGIGTTTPENAEGWARTLDLYGKASAKLSVRMDGIDARLMAHTGFWGAPAGMVLGTKTNHAVSIATKATSRVTVTATGDVGIGTATPSARLDVAGKGGTSIDLVVNGRLKSNNQDGGLWVTDDRFIGGLADGKVGFFNETAGWGLVMAKSGDVGIGTTTPENGEGWARTLDLYGKASAKLSVRMDGIDARLMAHTGFWGAPAGMVLGTKTNHAVSIATKATSRVTVTATGDVGIGTATPSARLDVAGKGGTSIDLVVNGRLKSNNQDGGLWVTDDRFIGGLADGKVGFFNKDADWGLVMAKSGDVGIGTTTPENGESWKRVLDVVGSSNTKLSLRTTQGSAIDGRVMVHSDGIYGAEKGMIVGTTSQHALSFITNGAKRMYIAADGQTYFDKTIWFPIVSLSGWGGEGQYGDVNTRYYWTLGRWKWNTNNPAWDYASFGVGSKMPSDSRLKETLVELDGAASQIERLRGVSFTWNERGLRYLTRFVDDQVSAGPDASEEAHQAARDDVRRSLYPALARPTIGVIAQEVEQVLPELVYVGEDGIMKVDYGKLSAVLVQAVKEQQGAIRTLTERLDILATTRPTDPEEN